jgi:hypothetical protein
MLKSSRFARSNFRPVCFLAVSSKITICHSNQSSGYACNDDGGLFRFSDSRCGRWKLRPWM